MNNTKGRNNLTGGISKDRVMRRVHNEIRSLLSFGMTTKLDSTEKVLERFKATDAYYIDQGGE
jgi:elongation factor P hydroxylase